MTYKKITIAILILAVIFIISNPASAESGKDITAYLFYGEGCPHCKSEIQYLGELQKEIPELKVEKYEVWNNKKNAQKMEDVANRFNAETGGVPMLFIGDKYVSGYFSDSTSGAKIKQLVRTCLEEDCPDVAGEVLHKSNDNNTVSNITEIPDSISVPLLGEINIKSFSLPVLSIVIGGLDGFNPCAMWVLLFLISLLINIQNRTRMWVLGSAFIIASAAVYFVFLAAWLNVFLFLGMTRWLQVIIAIVALYTGYHHLRQYWKNRKGLVCEASQSDNKRKIIDKLKSAVEEKTFWLALIGIVLLAAAVNMIELVCSAGLPAVFTGILSLSNLSAWQYYGYLLLYILFFMLDDLIVFIIAMVTLKAAGVSSGKYSRFSSLVGGLIMIIIGVLFLFKPGWLML